MKIFVATIVILISLYIIKVDLFEGTIPLAFFPTQKCVETMDYITVKKFPGDTLNSLFAMYPANKSITNRDRLMDFYELNPHLVKQSIQDGELVFLPIYITSEGCKNEK